jgi:sensor histidine kinase YesM
VRGAIGENTPLGITQYENLSRAQLAALRGQMEPHFMFNTLNSIAALVRDQRNDASAWTSTRS